MNRRTASATAIGDWFSELNTSMETARRPLK